MLDPVPGPRRGPKIVMAAARTLQCQLQLCWRPCSHLWSTGRELGMEAAPWAGEGPEHTLSDSCWRSTSVRSGAEPHVGQLGRGHTQPPSSAAAVPGTVTLCPGYATPNGYPNLRPFPHVSLNLKAELLNLHAKVNLSCHLWSGEKSQIENCFLPWVKA